MRHVEDFLVLIATHSNTLQHNAVRMYPLPLKSVNVDDFFALCLTHCNNTLQHAAPHCDTNVPAAFGIRHVNDFLALFAPFCEQFCVQH